MFSELGADCFENSAGVRKLTGLFFGVDFLAVDAHFENSATCRYERERTNILFEPEQFFRQTDGMRLVVSDAAIFDGNLQFHTGGQ